MLTALAVPSPAAEAPDPVVSLQRAAAPLPLVEQFLEGDGRDAVQAYYESLLTEGKSDLANRVRCLLELYQGNDAGARQALEILGARDSWAESRAKYLAGLAALQTGFSETRSDHFVLRVPTDDAFLADYALPALENAYARFAEGLGGASSAPVVAEIYPTLESFAFAATLPPEAVERTGLVGAYRFGRLMVLSPRAVPGGYRWLDNLVRQHAHGTVRRLSGARCPTWLAEGTARYLEWTWRSDGPFALPAAEANRLASSSGAPSALPIFAKMEPALIHAADAATVAFAQTAAAHAVSRIVEERGFSGLRDLLASYARRPRSDAFGAVLGVSEPEWENAWRESLAEESFPISPGAMPATVSLAPMDETAGIAPAADRLKAGDRLRRLGQSVGAAAQYQKALEEFPDNGVLLTRAARTELAAGRSSDAEPLLKRAAEKNPGLAEPRVLLGDLYFEDGRYEEAQAVLQGALEIDPFHPKIHEVLGLIAVDVGNFTVARRSLQLSLRFDVDNDAVREALKRMPKPR